MHSTVMLKVPWVELCGRTDEESSLNSRDPSVDTIWRSMPTNGVWVYGKHSISSHHLRRRLQMDALSNASSTTVDTSACVSRARVQSATIDFRFVLLGRRIRWPVGAWTEGGKERVGWLNGAITADRPSERCTQTRPASPLRHAQLGRRMLNEVNLFRRQRDILTSFILPPATSASHRSNRMWPATRHAVSDARCVYPAALSDDIIAEGSACPSFDRQSGLQTLPPLLLLDVRTSCRFYGLYRAHTRQ